MTDDRPKPRYGEYAPEGWVNPVAPVDTTEEARVTDRRVTGRGERPATPAPSGSEIGSPTAPPVLSTGRRVDRVVTFVLLGLAVYNVVSNIVVLPNFSADLLAALSASGNMSGQVFPADAFTREAALQQAGLTVAIVSVVAFAVTLALTIRRMRASKVSFWVPLVVGVAVSIVQLVVIASVFAGDAAFVQAFTDSLRG